MTKHARMVLADCEESLLELMNAKQNTMRRRWVATVSLLRAVGNVSDRVDGETSPSARSVIDKKFMEVSSLSIFKDFIKKERDNVLKQYLFSVRGDVTISIPSGARRVSPAPPSMPPGSIGMMTDALGTEVITQRFTISPFTDGPFAGRHPIELVQEAVAFWHEYLDDVDRRVSVANGAKGTN